MGFFSEDLETPRSPRASGPTVLESMSAADIIAPAKPHTRHGATPAAPRTHARFPLDIPGHASYVLLCEIHCECINFLNLKNSAYILISHQAAAFAAELGLSRSAAQNMRISCILRAHNHSLVITTIQRQVQAGRGA